MQSIAQSRVPRRPHPTAPHQGYSTPVRHPWALWPPDLRALVLEWALSAPPRGRLEGPHDTLPNSESCGSPPSKVIAHPSERPGGVWPPDLRSLFLGGALLCSWLFLGGPRALTKPCTIPNPAEATPSRTHQGYNTPVTAPRGRLARQRAGTIFGWDSALDSPCAPQGLTQSLAHLRVPRRPHPAAPTKAIAHSSRRH